jgi:hypothetical protein
MNSPVPILAAEASVLNIITDVVTMVTYNSSIKLHQQDFEDKKCNFEKYSYRSLTIQIFTYTDKVVIAYLNMSNQMARVLEISCNGTDLMYEPINQKCTKIVTINENMKENINVKIYKYIGNFRKTNKSNLKEGIVLNPK